MPKVIDHKYLFSISQFRQCQVLLSSWDIYYECWMVTIICKYGAMCGWRESLWTSISSEQYCWLRINFPLRGWGRTLIRCTVIPDQVILCLWCCRRGCWESWQDVAYDIPREIHYFPPSCPKGVNIFPIMSTIMMLLPMMIFSIFNLSVTKAMLVNMFAMRVPSPIRMTVSYRRSSNDHTFCVP